MGKILNSGIFKKIFFFLATKYSLNPNFQHLWQPTLSRSSIFDILFENHSASSKKLSMNLKIFGNYSILVAHFLWERHKIIQTSFLAAIACAKGVFKGNLLKLSFFLICEIDFFQSQRDLRFVDPGLKHEWLLGCESQCLRTLKNTNFNFDNHRKKNTRSKGKKSLYWPLHHRVRARNPKTS